MSEEPEISDAVLDRVIERVLRRIADPKYLTLAGAKKRTGLSEATIERAVRAGKVRRNQEPNRLLVVTSSLDAWIEGNPDI